MQARCWIVLGLMLASAAAPAAADEVHYVERNGQTYRETRRTVQTQVPVVQYQQREQTVYREHLVAQNQQNTRTVFTPVTEYQCVTRMRGRWNPFVTPYYVQEYVPVRRWEAQQRIVNTPVYTRQLLPEKRIVQVPVTTHQVAEQEYITRVPVSSASGVGGVALLDNDPPRQSTAWQSPSGTTIR